MGKTKPALIITNDFDLPAQLVVRRYSRRWLVEKAISEQIEFFHLNRLSSSIVIKVDFDLTMSILTHNLFRLLAQQTDRYQQLSNERLYQQFIQNSAVIKVKEDIIEVWLEKKERYQLCCSYWLPTKDRNTAGWVIKNLGSPPLQIAEITCNYFP
jgi:hypothetical protein